MNLLRYLRLAKEGSWIIVGQIVSLFGSIALIAVLTAHLSPSQYGELALGMTVAGFVNQVATGGLGQGISRFYSVAAEKDDFRGYLKASWRLMICVSVLVSIIGALLISGLLVLGYKNSVGLTASALCLSLLSSYNSTISGLQNAARQRGIVVFHNSLDACLRCFFAAILLSYADSSSTAAVIGYVLSSILVAGSQLIFIRKSLLPRAFHPDRHLGWEGELWRYSWPFSAWGIFTWAQQASDRWALDAFTTRHDVGLYVALFQLGYYPLSMATTMAMSFLEPILFQISGSAKDHARNASVHRLAWRITVACLGITTIAFVLALIFHDLIFKLLLAPGYHPFSYLLPWVMFSSGLFSAGQILSMRLLSMLQSRAMLKIKISTAIFGSILNYLGAYIFGVIGVVGASLLFSFLYLVWMMKLSYVFDVRNLPKIDARLVS